MSCRKKVKIAKVHSHLCMWIFRKSWHRASEHESPKLRPWNRHCPINMPHKLIDIFFRVTVLETLLLWYGVIGILDYSHFPLRLPSQFYFRLNPKLISSSVASPWRNCNVYLFTGESVAITVLGVAMFLRSQTQALQSSLPDTMTSLFWSENAAHVTDLETNTHTIDQGQTQQRTLSEWCNLVYFISLRNKSSANISSRPICHLTT